MNKIPSTGKTTRLADEYIQKLFRNRGRSIIVKDHWDTKESNMKLVNIIANRLWNEHSIIVTIENIIYDNDFFC